MNGPAHERPVMAGRGLKGAIAIASCLATAALAEDPVFYAPGGVALSGYDVVAYFEVGRPVEGSSDNALMWRGVTWLFSTPDRLMSFEMNPQAYAPQFGGYCAYGVAKGLRASSEPEAFFVQDGKLYFMHTASMLQSYRAELPQIVSRAETEWPAVLAGQ